MRLTDIKGIIKPSKEKIISMITAGSLLIVCFCSSFVIDSLLDYTDVQAKSLDPTTAPVDESDIIPEQSEGDGDYESAIAESIRESEKSTEESSAPAEQSAESQEESTPSEPDASQASEPAETAATESTQTTETSETTETTEATRVTETTAAKTSEPKATEAKKTAKPTRTPQSAKPQVTETDYQNAVYAKEVMNVRSGPGTEYSVVKSLKPGDRIDVVAKTSNGWYKTYNGNYVKMSLTTETAPKATATPVPAPVRKTNESNTNANTSTKSSSSSSKSSSSSSSKSTKSTSSKSDTKKVNTKDGVKCQITFYGPQRYKKKDGTYYYSKATAIGTTCKQGRTCAADWSIFPKGTKIYIENDPLGGDGIYTVEDCGPGVKGYQIDVYVDDEAGWNTTYRKVYQK